MSTDLLDPPADATTTPPPAGAERIESDPEYAWHIPRSAATWAGFGAWIASDDFPDRGRISFLGEEIVVDMSPERLDSHIGLKTELTYVLHGLVYAGLPGTFFCDGTLVSNKAAELHHEPDGVFVSTAAVTSGRVVLTPSADGADKLSVAGSPDLVVEIISPSSVGKDTRVLRARYHAADIPEYWLIDARGDPTKLLILRRTPTGYEPTPADAEGWIASAVTGYAFRFTRTMGPIDLWRYHLQTRPAAA